jgi:hypothetical protein
MNVKGRKLEKINVNFSNLLFDNNILEKNSYLDETLVEEIEYEKYDMKDYTDKSDENSEENEELNEYENFEGEGSECFNFVLTDDIIQKLKFFKFFIFINNDIEKFKKFLNEKLKKIKIKDIEITYSTNTVELNQKYIPLFKKICNKLKLLKDVKMQYKKEYYLKI